MPKLDFLKYPDKMAEQAQLPKIAQTLQELLTEIVAFAIILSGHFVEEN